MLGPGVVINRFRNDSVRYSSSAARGSSLKTGKISRLDDNSLMDIVILEIRSETTTSSDPTGDKDTVEPDFPEHARPWSCDKQVPKRFGSPFFLSSPWIELENGQNKPFGLV